MRTINLFKYQIRAIQHLWQHKRRLLIASAGLGKTIIGLSLCKILLNKNPEARILVITKRILLRGAWGYDNWDITNFRLPLVIYDSKRKLRKIKNIQTIPGKDPINITLISQDQVGRRGEITLISPDRARRMADVLLSKRYDMVIVDESRMMGKIKSKRTKFLLSLKDRTDRFYMMTAYPAPNSRLQLYPQLKAAGYEKTYTYFKNYFFYVYEFIVKFKKKKEEELHALVSRYAYIIDKESPEVKKELKFGKQHNIPIRISTPKTILAYINRLSKTGVISYENKDIIADSALKERLMHRFLAMGNLYMAHQDYRFIDDFRLEALKEVIENIQRPTMILFTYIADLERIEKMLEEEKKIYKVISGKTSDSQPIINWFKEARNTEILVAQGQTVKYGLSFNNCKDIIFYDIPDDADVYLQGRERVHRAFQTDDVFYHLLIAEGTIDEVIYDALTNKVNVDRAIKDYLEYVKRTTRNK